MSIITESITGLNSLTEKEVKKALSIIDSARKKILSEIAVTDWDIYHLEQIQKSVESTMMAFKDKYKGSLLDAEISAWGFGLDMVESTSVTQVSISSLEILQAYSADKITNMTLESIQAINDIIAVNITGGYTLQETAKQIGKNLTDSSVFKSIASRAETIARTEIGTINSFAREARAQEVMKLNPDRKFEKTWIHSGKAAKHSRKTHRKLDGVTIPVDKDFSIKGNKTPVPQGQGMAYPHAPGLPAKERINCGCVHVVKIKK